MSANIEAPADWPETLRQELYANRLNGQVGTKLVSQTNRVRVWHLALKPGQRLSVHTHVLDYFWTAVTPGKTRSHYGDGRIVETEYAVGDTRHFSFGPGESMTHDIENIGETALIFTAVEFLDSANRPLPLPGGVDR